jgi:hypothetical protein
MGDAGFLVETDVRLKEAILFGDTVWCRGTITGKEEPNLVQIGLVAESQVGATNAEGQALVRLPLRRS